MARSLLVFLSVASIGVAGLALENTSNIDTAAQKILPEVIEWRRHLHEYPELSNREFKTAKYVADFLKSLALEVRTGIAKTGVIAILKGGKPGPVLGLRADMDALPLKSKPFSAFISFQV